MQLQELVNNKALAQEKGIELPLFEKQQASAGILHIGVGRFHRSHQALYVQELMNAGALEWGICGVCLLPQDRQIVEDFRAQGGFYSLVEQDQHGQKVKVIGSILDIIPGYDDPQAVVSAIANPKIQIITLTVTEAGYFYNPADFTLQFDHPVVKHDLETPSAPKSIYGYLLAGLQQRKNLALPITIQSCDNIQGNGELLAQLLRSFVERSDQSLLTWFDKMVTFPNAMVDRITPAASEKEAQLLASLGIEDRLGIIAEPFRQWVLESEFATERPIYESAGVNMTDSVKPYEHMKVRLLNAGHSAIGYLGALAGFDTIHEIVQNKVMRTFLEGFLQDAAQTVPAPVGVDLNTYRATLVERFGNPTLSDQTLRICKDGSAKVPGFLLPSLLELLEANSAATHSYALVFAAWYSFVAREIKAGAALDDAGSEQVSALFSSSIDAKAFYSDTALFGSLGQSELFLDQVNHYAKQLSAGEVLEVVSSL